MGSNKADELVYRTDDGLAWAEAFMEMWGGRLDDLDVDVMHGWFVNAIETGRATSNVEVFLDG